MADYALLDVVERLMECEITDKPCLRLALTAANADAGDREGNRLLAHLGDGAATFLLCCEAYQEQRSREQLHNERSFMLTVKHRAFIAERLGIDRCIKYAPHKGSNSPKVKALAISALIGVVFLQERSLGLVDKVIRTLRLRLHQDATTHPAAPLPARIEHLASCALGNVISDPGWSSTEAEPAPVDFEAAMAIQDQLAEQIGSPVVFDDPSPSENSAALNAWSRRMGIIIAEGVEDSVQTHRLGTYPGLEMDGASNSVDDTLGNQSGLYPPEAASIGVTPATSHSTGIEGLHNVRDIPHTTGWKNSRLYNASTRALDDMKGLELMLTSLCSLDTFRAVLKLIEASRNPGSGHVPAPNTILSLSQRCKIIEETQNQMEYLRFVRFGHIMNLYWATKEERIVNNIVIDTESPQSLGPGNPRAKRVARRIDQYMEMIYPRLLPDTNDYARYRKRLLDMRRFGRNLHEFVAAFGIGVLALLVCSGDAITSQSSVDTMFVRASQKDISTMIATLKSRPGASVARLSELVQPMIQHLMNGNLESCPISALEHATDIQLSMIWSAEALPSLGG